jgi:hypothetical protein
MCERCEELRKKIDHYRVFIGQPFDALTVERIRGLIDQLERQLQAMH